MMPDLCLVSVHIGIQIQVVIHTYQLQESSCFYWDQLEAMLTDLIKRPSRCSFKTTCVTVLQGRVLSRLAQAKGPESFKDARTESANSEDLQAAAKTVEMTDLEVGKPTHDSHSEQDEGEGDRKRRGGSSVEDGRHVHMADLSADGSDHGGRPSNEADRQKTLWDDMLKRKLGVELDKQKKDAALESQISNTTQGEEEQLSRANSQAALLGTAAQTGVRVSETHTPSDPSNDQATSAQQPRFLSKQGLMGAIGSSRRFLPALLKPSDGNASQEGATAHHGGGGRGLANRMETAGSLDSNSPLLPAGMPAGRATSSSLLHSAQSLFQIPYNVYM